MDVKYCLGFVFVSFLVTGCGGPSESDKNPNPELNFSKASAPKRGNGVPVTTPRGVKKTGK